jgi:hypothetical protein
MLKGDAISLRLTSKVGPSLEGSADFELAEWDLWRKVEVCRTLIMAATKGE